MKSRFQNLVVSGCSFTTNEHVPDGSDWNWPNILARDTGMSIHNLARGGAGNSHIANSIILYLSQHTELTPENTLVMAMWSGIGRLDFLMAAELRSTLKSTTSSVTPQVVSVPAGHWWNNQRNTVEMSLARSVARTQSDHSFALASWLEMQKLENFLILNNFVYRFTSFVNYGDNQIRGDALVVPFERCLAEMNLTLNRNNWLPLHKDDHLGDWARIRGLLADDGFHPGQDAPQRWPREVVMPVLHQQGILQ